MPSFHIRTSHKKTVDWQLCICAIKSKKTLLSGHPLVWSVPPKNGAKNSVIVQGFWNIGKKFAELVLRHCLGNFQVKKLFRVFDWLIGDCQQLTINLPQRSELQLEVWITLVWRIFPKFTRSECFPHPSEQSSKNWVLGVDWRQKLHSRSSCNFLSTKTFPKNHTKTPAIGNFTFWDLAGLMED